MQEALTEHAATLDRLADPALDLAELLSRYGRAWAEQIGAGALADVRLDLQVVLHATEDDRFREQCLRLVELQEEQLAAVLTDRVVPGTGRSTSDAEAARLARALRSLALGFAVRAVLGGAGTEAEFPAACVALVALVDPS